jgi:hypothetical protein
VTVVYRDPLTGEKFVISGGERVPLTVYQERLGASLSDPGRRGRGPTAANPAEKV